MALSVGYEQFCESLRAGALSGGTLYDVAGVPDADTANRLMDEVRAYTKPPMVW